MASSFTDNKVYVIVPKADAEDRFELINRSLASSLSDLRNDDVGLGVSNYLFTVEFPPADVFGIYQWFDITDLIGILATPQWQGLP